MHAPSTDPLYEPIKVLDHGYVKLINYMGTDETIVEAARMSTDKGFQGWEKDANFLDFLWRHKHTSPFEMCELAIEVQAPLFVFREWHRHRTQSYNEFSARYSVMPNLHYVPSTDRLVPKVTANKQESSVKEIKLQEELLERNHSRIKDEQEDIYYRYEAMLEDGVPKEVARINTPVSRYSKMRAKTDLLNWLRFLNQRMRPNAQYEIRQYAEAVASLISRLWPRTWNVFEEHDLYSIHLGKSELIALRTMLGDLKKHLPLELGAGRKFDEFFQKLEKGGEEILS